MRKLTLILISASLAAGGLYSYMNLLGAFFRKKREFGQAYEPEIFFVSIAVFLSWQLLLAGGYFTDRAVNSGLAAAAWKNLKLTFIAIISCVPLTLIMIGPFVFPLVIAASTICISYSIICHQVSLNDAA